MKDSELIEALGNTSAVAHELRLDRRVVSNWKQRGIPADYRPLIKKMADETGIALSRYFLGPTTIRGVVSSKPGAISTPSTDAELIEALGGVSAVASTLLMERFLVSNWKYRGIPATYRPIIQGLAERKKINLPKDFLAPRAHRVSKRQPSSIR